MMNGMNHCGQTVVKGTTAMWAVNDDILPLGVFGIEVLDSNHIKIKVGDSVHKFSELPYQATDTGLSVVTDWRANMAYEPNTLVSYAGEAWLSKNYIAPSPIFNENEWLALTAVGLSEAIDSKLSKAEANRALLEGLTVSASATGVTIQQQKHNISDGTNSNAEMSIPVADTLNAGVMAPEMVNQVNSNTQRINALEGRISVFVVSFELFDHPDAPTQSELSEAFKTVSSLEEPFDQVTLVNEDDTSVIYRYYESVSRWIKDETAGVATAANGTLGLVKGAQGDGNIEVRADGSMFVSGYNKVTEGKTYPAATLTTNDTIKGTNNSLLKASIVEDLDGTKILDLTVTEDAVDAGLVGISINGNRISFNENTLLIKSATDEKNYKLEKGPYKVTSPYGCVEAYDNLFIFDELVKGKGVIRRPDGTLEEVVDLGIHAPESSINVIRVIDQDDQDVCYLLNEKNNPVTLCVYPDGSYKTCDFGATNRTPQNVTSIELLTSLDGKRHSYYMYNNHPNDSGTTSARTEYLLFQLEDCSLKILNATSKPCDGNRSAGTFNPGLNFGDLRFAWEAHTDQEDYEPESENMMDTSYADSKDLNRRFPYKTGQWQTESGSVMKHRRVIGAHNGVYTFGRGAQVFWGNTWDTNNQAMIVTPEGFIGWFVPVTTLQYWYHKAFRVVEIRSGRYKGKRALVLFSLNTGIKSMFIVNSFDGDPNNTVCVSINTDLNNLNHLSGLNPIVAAFNNIPSFIYTDNNRICLGSGSQKSRYFCYINQSEITPNVVNAETGIWEQKFDCHIIDVVKDTDGAFNAELLGWNYMDRVEFAEGNGTGTIVKSVTQVSLFLPDTEDTWDGDKGVRPYFIRHPSDVTTYSITSSGATTNWIKAVNTCATWHGHHIQCLSAGGATATTTLALDFYYDRSKDRIVCRALTFATGFMHLPIIIDSKHMIIWASNNTARCVALTWNEEAQDFTVTDGGAWVPPRGTNGHILYVKKPTEQEMDAGIKPKLYFFDTRTARTDYLALTYTEDETGNSVPKYTTHKLPKSMTVGHIIAYPNYRLVITNGAADTALYYFTIEADSTVAVTFPDSVLIQKVFDITNKHNPEENPYGAFYLNTDLTESVSYILERDTTTGVPVIVRIPHRALVCNRLWALPSRVDNGVQLLRFAMGSNQGVATTASSPFFILERRGGTVKDGSSAISFTRIRDFGSDTAGAGARADLPVKAGLWTEPHLVTGEQGVVRFMLSKTPHAGDGYSQFGDCALLGYDNENRPVYGERVALRTANDECFHTLSYVDEAAVEVGLTFNRDSYIYFGAGYSYVYKIKELWEAFEEDTAFCANSVFAGGEKCTLWLGCNETDNYYGRGPNRIIVENQIISSTINGHQKGQYTHMAFFGLRTAAVDGGTATTMGPQQTYGYAFEFKFRKHHFFMRDLSIAVNVANWSINEAPVIVDMKRNTPYAALGAAEYLIARGVAYVPAWQSTARVPMFQRYENQIVPGLYYRRNNQDVPAYSGANANHVPYFRFDDTNCDLVFKDTKLAALAGVYPFTGNNIRCSHGIKAKGTTKVFMTRELFEQGTGNAIVMCFWTENGRPMYKDIVIQNANEIVWQLCFHNGKMRAMGHTKVWEIDIDTFEVELLASPPYMAASNTFDIGNDIASFEEYEGHRLYLYNPQGLKLEYNGKPYASVPLNNLLFTGQTAIESLMVSKKISASTIEASNILLTSRYPNLYL